MTSAEAYENLSRAFQRRDSAIGPAARREAERAVDEAREAWQRAQREETETAAVARSAVRAQEREAEARRIAARPDRWRALSPVERALYIVAGEHERPVRTTLLRLAEVIQAETATPSREPPTTFESRRDQ